MRQESSLLSIPRLVLILGCVGVSCRSAHADDDVRADFAAYCQNTMACEGENPNAVHHVCMMAPIPFGMMLCEGNNARAKNACVAAAETFRNEADAFGCSGEFSAMFRCLHQRSTCSRNEFDQSPCRGEIRAMTSCVNAASGTHAAVSGADSTENTCALLTSACAACNSPGLGAQCRTVASIGDDGTCAQALAVVRQTCASPAS